MSGTFSSGGLITGIDSATLIAQLMQIERRPVLRMEDRITALEEQQTAVRTLRTTLQTLRNTAQDFRFNNIFNAFQSTSSKPEVLTSSVTGSAPVTGSFAINVTQLATATEAVSSGAIGAPINTGVALNSSGITTEITAGNFTINGVTFAVDPTTDTLSSILADINASAAGVTASYDSLTDKVTIANTTSGDASFINFGGTDSNTSNFLDVINVRGATQAAGVGGSTTVSSTRNLGAVSTTEALNSANVNGTVTSGTFSVNGVAITIDPSSDTILDVIGAINESEAGVTASYDTATDTIRVVSNTLGSPTIRFGSAGDTSNFLDLVNLDTAVQTAGVDAQFTVNGGAVQTRNTNSVSDAIGGVTLDLLSVGTSTVTISSDEDAIVEDIQKFVEEFNTALNEVRSLVGPEGVLRGDGGIRSIETYLVGTIFSQVSGLTGDYQSMIDLGISSGEDFNSDLPLNITLDEEKFREALKSDRSGVISVFVNDAENGIADQLFTFLDDATKTSGFLNERSKDNGTIDQQIQSTNDQIDRLEARLLQRENRLRRQFTSLEQISAVYQNQAAALSRLGSF
ncbi:MAG: flagellar filament capping protein FliD [Candidatus Hydrogenedentes bacterium]|nr:flagellar filament capping protein FliD [Candidatus Hydrogenedentota bacterium]